MRLHFWTRSTQEDSGKYAFRSSWVICQHLRLKGRVYTTQTFLLMEIAEGYMLRMSLWVGCKLHVTGL